MAQRSTESSHDLRRIILAAIEAAVDDLLDAATQGLKEGCNDERGDNNGDITVLVDDAAQEGLQRNDEAYVDQG